MKAHFLPEERKEDNGGFLLLVLSIMHLFNFSHLISTILTFLCVYVHVHAFEFLCFEHSVSNRM